MGAETYGKYRNGTQGSRKLDKQNPKSEQSGIGLVYLAQDRGGKVDDG